MSYLPPHRDHVLVTVQEETRKPGRVLQAKFKYGAEVTKPVVERVIAQGIKKGWNPSDKGPAVNIGNQDGLLVTFLDDEDQVRLRVILDMPAIDDPGFVAALENPPIDQDRIFQSYPIPLKERGIVVAYARRALLSQPSLIDCPKDLEEVVEIAVIRDFGSMGLSGYKLVKCDKPCGKCKKKQRSPV